MQSSPQLPEHSSDRVTAESLLKLLAAAPHRLLFLGGVTALLLSMLWWSLWLLAARFSWWSMPQSALPAGWGHVISMQFQALPLFMFGFLLTVFPRWMNLPAFGRAAYLPVSGSIFVGYLCFLARLLDVPYMLQIGLVLTALGWSVGLLLLFRLLWLDGARCYHAVSCWLALAMGLVGLVLALTFLYNGNPTLMFGAIKIGTFGLLLPIFLTVCHRMLPFFSQLVIPNYRPFRPGWLLALLLSFSFAHLLLELAHGQRWMWVVDAPMALLAASLSWRWGLFAARKNRLLLALHLGFAWLAPSFALYAVQSLIYATSGEYLLGRAPVHALTVGFFGTLVIAMVTRVTQGHSGRPLQMGALPWVCLLSLQLVVLMRIVAELSPDPLWWQALAATGWVIALLPWICRSAWLYLIPRADGKPG